MHLGLIDRPFVPHNLVSAQWSPVPLLKFQMAHRFKILMPSRSKKGNQIYFFFSLKIPSKRTPSNFPNRAAVERDTRLKVFSHISRNQHNNYSKYGFFSLKALRTERPSMFHKSRVHMEGDTHFQSLT
jgi:hypothetical protein